MKPIRFDWKLSDSHPLNVRCSHHSAGKVNTAADMHSSVHIGILIHGDTTGLHNGELISVPEGGIYLTAPWEQHQTTGSKNGNDLLLITADPDAVARALLSGAEKLNQLYRIPPAERQKILNRLKISRTRCNALIRLLQKEDTPERELRLWYASLGIFMEICMLDFSAVPDPDYLRLLPALQHLGNRPLTVARAAEYCHLSESRFAHLFSRVFGMPFARYERLYRLRCASDEMQRLHSGLKETAERWGFCDKSHLSKAWHKNGIRSASYLRNGECAI